MEALLRPLLPSFPSRTHQRAPVVCIAMLGPLFQPETVAVIGASPTPGKLGHELLKNLLGGGFGGEIVPVNPRGGEILGLACRRDLREHRGRVDLGVVAVPTLGVKDAVRSALDAGARAVVVITAGFKEVGAEGAALEREIAAPFRRRRKIAAALLDGATAVRAVPCDGAMYVMLDIRATGMSGEAFALALLQAEHIAVMPGESFGRAAAGHLRVAMTIDDDRFADALGRLVAFAEGLARAA